MNYHARLEYGPKSHFFYNYSKTSLIEKVVIPFVNGQVIMLNFSAKPRLFNMKNASFLKIYRTRAELKVKEDKTVAVQMKEQSFAENDCTAEVIGEIQSQGSSKELSSLIQKALQPPKQRIFVVMKFGDDILDSAYEGAYKVVAEEFGLSCLRIDEIQDSGKISDQILEAIAGSKYVLCDLTGARPNCYYETGFAHALGKEIILIAHKNEKIHFDLQGHRFIQWATEEDLRRRLRERLSSMEAEMERGV